MTMQTTTTTYPTLGHKLAADLRRHRAKLRRRTRPRAKRPAKRKAKPSALEAELRKTPQGQQVLEALGQERELRTAVALGEYTLRLAEDSLRSLRESQEKAYHARDRAASAAARLKHHKEAERLGVQIRDAEAGVRESRALLADTRQQLEGASAGVDMAVRGLVS
jgi:hypothetical protein